jgi:hypothetical protein
VAMPPLWKSPVPVGAAKYWMLKVSAEADAAAKRPTARIATTPERGNDLVTVMFLFRGCRIFEYKT